MNKHLRYEQDVSLVDTITAIISDRTIPIEIQEKIARHAMNNCKHPATKELFLFRLESAGKIVEELKKLSEETRVHLLKALRGEENSKNIEAK